MAIEGYDLVMIGILAVAALLGYFKGIVWQIAWIAGIVASSFVALRFSAQAAPWFRQPAPWDRYLAMLALYAGTSMAVWLLFRLISGFINAIHLSAFDHQLGLLLGAAKGALLCVVVTFFAVTLAPSYRHQIVASRSGRFVADLIVRADTYLPKELHDTVEPFVDEFERQFAQPGDGRAALPGGGFAPLSMPGAGGTSAPAPQLSLQSLVSGVSSVAAWAGGNGAGGGGGAGEVHQAGGPLPAGAAWFAAPGSQAAPAGGPVSAPAGRQVSFQSFAPIEPPPAPAPAASGSRYANPVASPFGAAPEPPGAYPVGAQSPLPRR